MGRSGDGKRNILLGWPQRFSWTLVERKILIKRLTINLS